MKKINELYKLYLLNVNEDFVNDSLPEGRNMLVSFGNKFAMDIIQQIEKDGHNNIRGLHLETHNAIITWSCGVESFIDSNKIEYLSIKDSHHDPDIYEFISERLEQTQHLTYLTLKNVAYKFIKSAQESSFITYLDISGNALTVKNGIELSRALEENNTIKFLNVSDNKLKDSVLCILYVLGPQIIELNIAKNGGCSSEVIEYLTTASYINFIKSHQDLARLTVDELKEVDYNKILNQVDGEYTIQPVDIGSEICCTGELDYITFSIDSILAQPYE